MAGKKAITTDRQVNALKPSSSTPANGDWYSLGDGLYIAIKPTGRKTFYFQYNRPMLNEKGKKPRNKIAIGEYGAITLADARAVRDEYRLLIQQGIDPQHHKTQNQQQEQTIRQVVTDFFENHYSVSDKTKLENLSKFQKHLFPIIGDLPVNQLTPQTLAECYGTAFKKAESVADKISALMYRALEVQASKGVIDYATLFAFSKVYDPFRRARKPSQKMRAVNLNDFGNVMQAMTESAKEGILMHSQRGIMAQTLLLFYFYLLTGMRSSECVGARWEYIDTGRNLLVMPSDVMKQTKIRQQGTKRDHVIPISGALARVLNVLKRLSYGSEWIFPALCNKSKSGHMGAETVNRALSNVGFKDKQTAHGLRTIIRTHLEEKGVRYEIAESIIDHDTSRRALDKKYIQAQHYTEEKRPVMEQIAEFLIAQGMDLALIEEIAS